MTTALMSGSKRIRSFPDVLDPKSAQEALQSDCSKAIAVYEMCDKTPILLWVFHKCLPADGREVPSPETMAYAYVKINTRQRDFGDGVPAHLLENGFKCACKEVYDRVKNRLPRYANSSNSRMVKTSPNLPDLTMRVPFDVFEVESEEKNRIK